MSPPTQQKALLLQTKQGEFVVGTRPVPKPAPGEILVKNEYVALNPADWKIRELGFMIQTYPAVLGIDASGTVEAVGEGVDKFKLGDKVYVSVSIYGWSLLTVHSTVCMQASRMPITQHSNNTHSSTRAWQPRSVLRTCYCVDLLTLVHVLVISFRSRLLSSRERRFLWLSSRPR